MAQWTLTVALCDAWAAVFRESPSNGTCNGGRCTPGASSCDRAMYTAFGEEGDASADEGKEEEVKDEGGACEVYDGLTQVTPIPSRLVSAAPYQLCAFPSSVEIRNKYFAVNLSFVVGASSSLYASKEEVLAALSQSLPHTSRCAGQPRSYGGVLTANVKQDPAEMPWHLLPRGQGCAFRAVMVFLQAEDNAGEMTAAASNAKNKVNASAHVSSAAAAQRERWQYFAVENGYECIFHAPLTRVPSMGNENEFMEVVSTSSGRRGLLEAPLEGSNRLYQLLCNTLWPVEVRIEVSNERSTAATSTTMKDQHHSEQPLHPAPSSNAFVVVGNNAKVMLNLFTNPSTQREARTRRQQRFFTKYVENKHNDTEVRSLQQAAFGASPEAPLLASESPDVSCDDPPQRPARSTTDSTHPFPRRRFRAPSDPSLVLINKYYAAVAQPQLLQTAFFSPPMQDMLDRYWEQRFAASDTQQHLCAAAPALVLWPPSPSASSSFSCVIPQTDFYTSPSGEQVANTGAAEKHSDAGVEVRSAYPPLETILDVLTRHGCGEIVVVVSATTSLPVRKRGDAAGALTPYELHLCAERGVEVVDLRAVHSTPSQRLVAAVTEGMRPLPVLRDEDDVCATRAIDRLEEILHCVQWDHSYPLPPPLLDRSHGAPEAECDTPAANTCLLLTFGLDAFEEEAWMEEVVAALQPAVSSNAGTADAVTRDMADLAAVAPSIAAALHHGSAQPRRGRNLPSHPVQVCNSYFTADVKISLYGGLSEHYGAPNVSAVSSGSFTRLAALQPDWLDAYDGYVIVTSLQLLREAGKAADDREPQLARVSEFLDALRGLSKKAASWLSTQHTGGPSPCTDTSTDTPLALLYVTDGCCASHPMAPFCADEVSTALNSVMSCATRDGGGSSSDDEETFLALEIVVASSATSSASYLDGDDFMNGTQRIREAFQQQLWPHRCSLPPRYQKQQQRRLYPSYENDSSSHKTESAPNIAAKKSTTEAVPQKCTRVPDAAPDAAAATASVKGAEQPEAVLKPSVPAKADSVWIAPAVGCALPPDFLIDPESLRSVPLHSACGSERALTASGTARAACGASAHSRKGDPSSYSAAPAAPYKSSGGTTEGVSHSVKNSATSLTEEELMVWMEKMKTYGHRLGEVQRREQAATLALVLESLL